MTIVAIANQPGAAGGVDAGIAPIGPLPMTGEAGAFDAVMATLLPVVPPLATAAPLALPAAANGPGRGDATDTGALPDAPHVVGLASALATSIAESDPYRALTPDADSRGAIDPVPVSGPVPIAIRQLWPEVLDVIARNEDVPPVDNPDRGGRWTVLRRDARVQIPDQLPEHLPVPPFAPLAVPPPVTPPAGPALHVASRQQPAATNDTFAAIGAKPAASDGINSDADGEAVSLVAVPAVMAFPSHPVATAAAIAPASGNVSARRLVEMPDTPAPLAAALATPIRRKESATAATAIDPTRGTMANGLQPGMAANMQDNAIVIPGFVPAILPQAPPIIATPTPAAADSGAAEVRPRPHFAPAGRVTSAVPVATPAHGAVAGPPVVVPTTPGSVAADSISAAAAAPVMLPVDGSVRSATVRSDVVDAPGLPTAVPPLVPQSRAVASAGQFSASVAPPFAPEITRNPPPAPARALALPMPRRELPRPAPDPQPVAAPISPMGIPPATTSAAIADVVAAPAAIADTPPEPGLNLAIASARLGPVRITVEGSAGDLRIALHLPAVSVALVSADAPRLVADLAAQGVRLAALDIGGGQPGMQQSPQQQGDQRGRYAPAPAMPLLAEVAGVAPRVAILPRPDRYA